MNHDKSCYHSYKNVFPLDFLIFMICFLSESKRNIFLLIFIDLKYGCSIHYMKKEMYLIGFGEEVINFIWERAILLSNLLEDNMHENMMKHMAIKPLYGLFLFLYPFNFFFNQHITAFAILT